ESQLNAVHGRTYSIKTAALSTIRGEIQRYGGKQAEIPHAGQRLSPSVKTVPKSKKEVADRRQTKPSSSAKASLFNRWVDEGYFDTPRVLRDVQDRFHAKAHIVPRTAIPGYLLQAVRVGRLKR